MQFTVAGGDRRQAVLAQGLMEHGHNVRCFAVPGMPDLPLPAAMAQADCLILPMPALDGTFLRGEAPVPLSTLLQALPADAVVYGGCLDGIDIPQRAVDYAKRESFIQRNAELTAEGALPLLMERLFVSIEGLSCLIVGWGRIGKALAARLRALGADVTVSARKQPDLAAIEAAGYAADTTGVYARGLSQYQAVLNTVPAMVLPAGKLAQLRADCVVMDLASKPGGVERDACKSPFLWALGIPGTYAPVTAGLLLQDLILADFSC